MGCLVSLMNQKYNNDDWHITNIHIDEVNIDISLPSVGNIPTGDVKILSFNKTIWMNDGVIVAYQDENKIAWFHHNMIRRIDHKCGIVEYFYNGMRHRDGDEPAVIDANGSKQWWINGEIHRENKPAVIFANGDTQWWHHGLLHRLNGPAIETYNGMPQWWINGKCIDESDQIINSNISANILTLIKIVPIGQGQYGAVYDQCLQCKNTIFNTFSECKNCVTKKFFNPIKHINDGKSPYQSEVTANEYINTIDSNGNYHLKMLFHCDTSISYLDADNKYLPCTPLIYFECGVNNFQNVLCDLTINISQLMKNLQNLFNGIDFFQLHNFYHFDIKVDNIMSDISGKLKFIDFGLAKTLDELMIPSDFYIRVKPSVWPPEIILLVDNVQELYYFKIYLENYIENISDYHPNKISHKMLGKIMRKNIYDFQQKSIISKRDALKSIAEKIDVFSLGIVMCKVYIKLYNETSFSDINMLCDLHKLIMGMIDFDSNTRLSSGIAKKMYEDIVNKYIA